jgi:3-hydroxyisobutyrate dehydrogenase
MQPGGVLVDMTTSSPALAQRLAAAANARGGQVLDAPVTGGDRGAREATLSIMVGGDAEAFSRVRPLLDQMGRTVIHHGPAGSGQHCKLCNQIAIAANMIGVCEALAYASRSGLDAQTVLRSIANGAAGSWSLQNLAPRILAGDFAPGFFVKHFIKDMTLAATSADAMDLDTPGLDLALALYRRLAEEGGADDGTQALFRLYAEEASKGAAET